MEDPVRLLAQDDDALGASLLRSARDVDRDDARAHKALVLGAAGGAVGGAAIVAATKLTSRGLFAMMGVKGVVSALAVVSGLAVGAAMLWPPLGGRSLLSGGSAEPGASAIAAPPPQAAESASPERADSPSKQAESNDPPADVAPRAAEPPPATTSDAARAKSVIAQAPTSARDDKPISADAPAATATTTAGAAAHAGSAGLAEEVQALKAAHDALGKGQPARCLEAVSAYFAAFPKGHLSAEARYLRVEALSRSGKQAEAAALARSMLDANPRSPYAARLRAIAGEP